MRSLAQDVVGLLAAVGVLALLGLVGYGWDLIRHWADHEDRVEEQRIRAIHPRDESDPAVLESIRKWEGQ